MIVKCQKPLISLEPAPPVLIHSQDRQFEITLPLDDAWERIFADYGLPEFYKAKLFAEAHIDGDLFVMDRVFDGDLGW